MNEKEVLTRFKTGNFNGGYGFDLQLLVNAVGTIGEMFKSGQISKVVRCKDCKHATMTSDGKMCKYCAMDTDDFGDQRNVYHDADWFCADGEPKESGEVG